MSEYRETTIIGSSYQRGRTLIFENPRNAAPSILIKEETVNIFPTKEIAEPAGEIRKIITDLSITFPIRNPATNIIIEGQTATYQDLFVLLYSLYWHLAVKRDEEIANQTNPEIPE